MKRLRGILSVAGLAAAVLMPGSASAVPVVLQLSDFVMFAGGGIAINSGDELQIGGHTAIHGNIGSNEDIAMAGNPVNGFPALLDGSAYAGRDITLGQELTVGDAAGPLREIVANRDANVGGAAIVYGNVYGNRDVSLGQDTELHSVGGSGGNVEYTNNYSDHASTIVDGTVTSPASKSFALIDMPDATLFSAGGVDQTVPNGSGSELALGQGTYGALKTSNQNQIITLGDGEYYFDEIDAASGLDLQIDLTNGPCKIFVVGNVDIGQNAKLLVKDATTGGQFVSLADRPDLAAKIYMETHGKFEIGGNNQGETNIWGGTLYASMLADQNGDEIHIGQFMEWYGAIYALDTIQVMDHGTWNYVPFPPDEDENPPVPEPMTLGLVGIGLSGLAAVRRRRNVKL